MSTYNLMVALHIFTATGMFMAWTGEWVEARRELGTRLYHLMGRFGMIAMLLTLISGIFLMMTNWGPRPWIAAALINLVGIIVFGIARGRRTPRAVLSTKFIVGLAILLLMLLKAGLALTIGLTTTAWLIVGIRLIR